MSDSPFLFVMSPVMSHLARVREHGQQVSVVVEIFDGAAPHGGDELGVRILVLGDAVRLGVHLLLPRCLNLQEPNVTSWLFTPFPPAHT